MKSESLNSYKELRISLNPETNTH